MLWNRCNGTTWISAINSAHNYGIYICTYAVLAARYRLRPIEHGHCQSQQWITTKLEGKGVAAQHWIKLSSTLLLCVHHFLTLSRDMLNFMSWELYQHLTKYSEWQSWQSSCSELADDICSNRLLGGKLTLQIPFNARGMYVLLITEWHMKCIC